MKSISSVLCALLLLPASLRAADVPLKLLFSGPPDVTNTWGLLHFGVTPVRELTQNEPLPFNAIASFPLPNGEWEVFGWTMKELTKGKEPFDAVNVWKLSRATTRDGLKFESPRVVFESEAGAWSDHFAMAYNPEAKEYLLLKLKMDNSGFGYYAFASADGLNWQAVPSGPLFYDGDSMSMLWSPVLHRFVCVSKSLQPWPKHIPDHGGVTPKLKDNSLRDRRVLVMRTSADGRHWEPSVSMNDVWNRNQRKDSVPAAFMTMPDAQDPPDLEFYSANAFWYYDRAYMTVLNYAASAAMPRKHAPQLDNEWWTSRDGLHWERPAREVNALQVDEARGIPRLEQSPLIADGSIIFPRGALRLGLKEDRLSYAGARANAEFSTRMFSMPAGDLFLNAASPAPERPFGKQQAYIMTAVLDDKGSVIPGFEADKCVIRTDDRIDIPLKWGEASARTVAGKNVRLKFLIRSANIYAVTAR